MKKLYFLLLPLLIVGCSTEHYKQDADDEVYDILEKKWNEDFGTKSNFRISDVAKGGNDIDSDIYDVTRQLTLVDAVSLATANNRDYQGRREDLYLSALDLSLERYDFSPKFFGLISTGYNYNSGDDKVELDGRLSFTQTLADGTEIAASLTESWTEYLVSGTDSLKSVFAASITKPLLRGAGRKIAQENLTLAERKTIYEMRKFARFRRTFVVGIISEYYGVLQKLDEVANGKRNYERLKFIEDQVVLKNELGLVPPFEVGQARQKTLTARDDYINKQRESNLKHDEFRITLALPTDSVLTLESTELDKLEKKGIAAMPFTLEQAVEIALANRLDLQTTFNKLEDAKRALDIAKNNLWIKLDLKASANLPSESNNEFLNFQTGDGSYSIGLETDNFDLSRKSERNTYRKVMISVMRSQRAYDLAVDEVKQDVRTDWGNLLQKEQSYNIQLLSLEIAEKRVEGDDLLYQEGRATIRDLLDSQEDLLQAQNRKTENLVSYTISKLTLYQNIGLLEVKEDGNVAAETVTKAIKYGKELK